MSESSPDEQAPDTVMTGQQPDHNDPARAPEVATARPATRLGELASGHEDNPAEGREVVFELHGVTISYSGKPAIRDVDLAVHKNLVTAFIGPSGCGKTTLLRSMNRLNDLIAGASVDGSIRYHGHDLNAPTWMRSRCGAGSAWSSSAPTRFPSRSTTTSPSACGC